jgi:hypothetical protein
MQTAFRHGWLSARATLGWIWPGAAALAALLAVAGAGVIEAQSISLESGARRVQTNLLEGVTFGLVLPLLSFALSNRIDAGLDALMGSLWVRYGLGRRAFALGRLAFPLALTSAVVSLVGSLALGLGAASSDPSLGLGASLGTSWGALLGCALLAAAAYTACLALAQLLGGAWGRALFLLGDWLLGTGDSLAALPWPRAHVRSLLGGDTVFDMAPASSGLWLAALTLTCLLLYVRKIPS